MSGIAGIFNFNARAEMQLPTIVSMATAMRHRGPDDEGFVLFQGDSPPLRFFGEDTPLPVRQAYPELRFARETSPPPHIAALAQRQLDTLSPSPGGHQPLGSADSRYWIVRDGTIYNAIELREELKTLGHRFKSNSDAEVVLAAYQQWGADCQSRFNGDWAFLIYDAQEDELFVSRDRFGVKPLYYYQDNERILFSSEIKGLLVHPAVKTSPNLDYLKSYLQSGAKEWLKETAFTNIFRFPFAHHAKISFRLGRPQWQTTRYWELKPNLSREAFNKERAERYAIQYYKLLKDAVRLRLRSDVPVGCALSGGLDSSSIVYLVDEIYKESGAQQRVKTFSLIHTAEGTRHCDESEFIYLLHNKLNLNMQVAEPVVDEIPKLAETVLTHWECPPDGTGMAGIFTLDIAKKNKCLVTLDGQGADEQLAGYENFLSSYLGNVKGVNFVIEDLHLLRNFGWHPGVVKQIALVFFQKLPRWIKLGILRAFRKNETYADSKRLNTDLALSTVTGLVNLIHYADSRSGYYSIDSRMPFMDHRLFEFNAAIPESYKIHKGFTKYYARMAFDSRLPSAIVWRKDKMGWPVPEMDWINGPLRDWFDSTISSSKILKDFTVKGTSVINISSKKVRLLNVALFEREFFQTPAVSEFMSQKLG